MQHNPAYNAILFDPFKVMVNTQRYLHRRIFVIWCRPGGQFNGRYSKTPDVSFEVIAVDLQIKYRNQWAKCSCLPFIIRFSL